MFRTTRTFPYMADSGKPPSEKQLGFLRCFGQSASTAADAHDKITKILDLPITEQARLRVKQMDGAISGSGGHNATFAVACMLIHGYALSQAEALPLMQEYNVRCQPAWSERELLYKLNSAERTAHDKPRGHLIASNAPARSASSNVAAGNPEPVEQKRVFSPRKLACEFDPKRLREMAGKWRELVNVEWLSNRSAFDVSTVGPRRFLDALYQFGEMVLVFDVFESQGQAFWPNDELPTCGKDGVWFLAQPVNGQSLPNPRTGKMSRRSMESVTAFRYLVLESDQADMSDWLGLLVQLPLRIEAIYTSGGKSVHALVRVDCRTHREWEEYVRGMMPTLNLLGMAGVDPKALTSVRLTRLPGCLRGDRMQKLLYLRPGAEVRPIAELPEVRDVTAPWLSAANRVFDGYEEPTRELRRALWYYSKANASCRAALREIEAAELTRER
jgi:hypothetical protein